MGQLESSVREEWLFWRPVLEKVVSYVEAKQLTYVELLEINTALNYHQKRQR